jgi:hypothetical protein
MERSGFGTVRRARSGRYQARVRVRGRQIAIRTFDTRREAARSLGRFAANYDALTLVDRKAGRQTVGEFAESWWKTRAGYRPSTRVRDREALDRDVLPFFRDAQLGRLDRADVQEWIEQLSQRLATATVRRTYVVLDQLLGVAVERGIIAASPAKGVQLPRIVPTDYVLPVICRQRPPLAPEVPFCADVWRETTVVLERPWAPELAWSIGDSGTRVAAVRAINAQPRASHRGIQARVHLRVDDCRRGRAHSLDRSSRGGARSPTAAS